MLRYSLRTLLLLTILGPPMFAWAYVSGIPMARRWLSPQQPTIDLSERIANSAMFVQEPKQPSAKK